MKVLMFGWEFPPHNRGGLGTACFGLTKALSTKDVSISFVLPKGMYDHKHLRMITTSDLYLDEGKIRMRYVDSLLTPYMTEHEYEYSYRNLMSNGTDVGDMYGRNLYQEVERYAQKARIIAMFEDHDVIHCHDWMTYKAGIQAKGASHKPLIVHVHATDFDRTGGNPNQYVYDIEREGMHAADHIIAVSHLTKNTIVQHYGIPEEKVTVVHNGIQNEPKQHDVIKDDENVVLFLGRLTLQKGPEYFIDAAKKVLDIMPDTKFIVAGSGDMYGRMVDMAAHKGIARKVLFTGHLKGSDVDRAYQMADLYVMPSVSEPFGITPLESLKNNTPVLISRQSGVSEVLPNALRVDFWDTDEMTNKIVGALAYGSMHSSLVDNGKQDVGRLTWDRAADKTLSVYRRWNK